MQDLLTDEALRSVQSRFNAVFAELDIEMRALDARRAAYLDRNQLEGMEQLRMPSTELARSPHEVLDTTALDLQRRLRRAAAVELVGRRRHPVRREPGAPSARSPSERRTA